MILATQEIKKRSFTLIELLVAVSVFAVIAVVLYSSFRVGIISYRRIESEQVAGQKMRYLLNRLEKDLKNMVYISNIPFEGSPGRVSFVSLLRQDGSYKYNIARISYYVESGEGSEGTTGLIREEEPLCDALSSGAVLEEPSAVKRNVKKTIIMEDVLGVAFSYLYVSEDEEGLGEQEWRELWEEEQVLPLGVKVELSFRLPGKEVEAKVSRRIWIPTGTPVSIGSEEQIPSVK